MREWLVAAWIVIQKNTPCEDFLSLLRGCLQISILVFLFLQNRLHWILCCWCWYSREKVSQELVYLNGGRHNVCVLIILEGCLTAMEVLSVVEWLIQNFDKWKVAGSIPVRHGNFFSNMWSYLLWHPLVAREKPKVASYQRFGVDLWEWPQTFL